MADSLRATTPEDVAERVLRRAEVAKVRLPYPLDLAVVANSVWRWRENYKIGLL